MKRGLLIVAFLLLLPFVMADEIFTVSFHSLGGNQSMSLDLVKLLKNTGPFKYSPVENVIVKIENGIVTIMPKDSAWTGIEDITFAPIGVDIKLETNETRELKQARAARRNITVSKYDLDTAFGEFIGQSFYVIARNLTGEPINISGFITKDTVSLEVNNEVSLNITNSKNRRSLAPRFIIDVHDRNANLSLAEYEDPSSLPFYMIVALFVFALVVITAYFYTGYAQDMFIEFLAETKTVDTKSAAVSAKRQYLAKLLSLRSRLAKEDPKSIAKEAMDLVNEFFSQYLRISFPSKDRVIDRLVHKGADKSMQSAVSALYDDYGSMMYGKRVITKGNASAFISKAISTVRQV